jgi:hypothetical protein
MMISDSRVSSEDGQSYPAKKIFKSKRDGEAFIIGATGLSSDCTKLIKWAIAGFKGTEPKWYATRPEDAVVGIILKDSGIHIWNLGDGPDPEKIESDYWAIGSGGKPARVALMLGKTAEEAMEFAIKVDEMFSGPPIQIIKLKED